jgi:hypothetical protein
MGSVLTAIGGIRGAGNLTLGDLNSNLAAIRGGVEDSTAELQSDLPQLIQTVGIPADGSIFTIWNMMYQNIAVFAQIRDAIGQETGDATTTVLGRLSAIERASLCACGPQPPSPSDPNGCAEPTVSSFSVAPEAYSGRVFAVWLGLPSGAEFRSELDPGVDAAEIGPSVNWAGWKAFILSRSSTIASLDPRQALVYATNTWIDLTSITYAAFNVPAGNDIQVYLCRDETVPEGCLNIPSRLSTLESDSSVTLNAISVAPTGMSFVNPVNSSNGEASWDPPAFVSGNLATWTLQVFSGTVRVLYRTDPPTSTQVFSVAGHYTSADGVVTLPTTDHFSLDDSGTDGPYSIQLCNTAG